MTENVEEGGPPRTKCRRYYVRDTLMEVEEDRTHEFKGHKNIAIEEIPPWCIDAKDKNRKTRNCISRNICGFLNSGLGGTVYLGVLDNGNIEGILLTPYQKDHLKLSLKDTMLRFHPPVPNHLISIEFVPCVEKSNVKFERVPRKSGVGETSCTPNEPLEGDGTENSNKGTLCDSVLSSAVDASSKCNDSPIKPRDNSVNGDNAGGWDWSSDIVDRTELPMEIKYKNDPLRKRPHLLQTYLQCWCDDDASSRCGFGRKSPAYVVEITVKPPSAKDPEIRKYLPPNSELLIQPIFQAEDGSVYIRRHATLSRRSLQDMDSEAVEDVKRVYLPILKEAQIHLGILEALVEKVELLEKVDDEQSQVTKRETLFQRIKNALK